MIPEMRFLLENGSYREVKAIDLEKQTAVIHSYHGDQPGTKVRFRKGVLVTSSGLKDSRDYDLFEYDILLVGEWLEPSYYLITFENGKFMATRRIKYSKTFEKVDLFELLNRVDDSGNKIWTCTQGPFSSNPGLVKRCGLTSLVKDVKVIGKRFRKTPVRVNR